MLLGRKNSYLKEKKGLFIDIKEAQHLDKIINKLITNSEFYSHLISLLAISFLFSKPGIRAIEAIRPRASIINAGKIDSAIRSSPAYWNMRTDRVSKSNGLSTKVSGNSFNVSTKTRRNPTDKGPLRSGRWTLLKTSGQRHPSPAAASSKLGEKIGRAHFWLEFGRVLFPSSLLV